MARDYFINPYTFIPFNDGEPVLSPIDNQYVHLFFDPTRFTGVISVLLTFVTPAVIPEKNNPGSDTQPGWLPAYRYQNRLAIPGSRIRGHLLNLMRAINSSPINHFNDRDILRREKGDHLKGVIISQGGQLKIRQIAQEVLVAAPGRNPQPNLANHCRAENNAVAYNGGSSFPIPDYLTHYNQDGSQISQPPQGTIYWQNTFERGQVNRYKRYLTVYKTGKSKTGRWIKFPCWSGQDEINALEDLQHRTKHAHQNSYHVVKDEWITNKDYDLPDEVLNNYFRGLEEAARLLEERGEGAAVVGRVRSAQNLEPGTFVYFEVEDNRVKSIGRHYRYLTYRGSVSEIMDTLLRNYRSTPCLVEGLSGFANDRHGNGLKGRIWAEMALESQLDEQGNNPILQEKNLRILSSQPPKSKNFYLEGGDYGDPGVRPRGRKFYWNDPQWNQKMWDNEDLREGDHGFENPAPSKNFKQWSKAEVLMATEMDPVSFSFKIRFMNLGQEELFLLLTAIVGFDPKCLNSSLCQSDWKQWCHKIGHARPFMGSAHMKVTGAQYLSFDDESWEPKLIELTNEDLIQWANQLASWQSEFLRGSHIEALKRVMRYDGAREGLSPSEFVPITYPLGQDRRNADGIKNITWVDQNNNELPDEKQPKTFHFFSTTQRGYTPPDLPKPDPGIDQRLPVKFG